MAKREEPFSICQLIALVVLAAGPAFTIAADDRPVLRGGNQLEFAAESADDSLAHPFEDWCDLSLGYGYLSANLGYELHLPAPRWSFDTTGQGLYRRSLTFSYKSLTLTAGTQYAMLGKGLTLRSYANRPLRWDTNLDGVSLGFASDKLDVKVVGGRMRDLRGIRLAPLQAGELQVRPLKIWSAGVTGVLSQNQAGGGTHWGSLYSSLRLPLGNIYGEFAGRDFLKTEHLDSWRRSGLNGVLAGGRAFYSEANLFVADFSLLAEYKYYRDFDLNQGVSLNNPPMVAREHLFTLMNRKQLVQNAGNEKGVFLEATYPPFADQILTASYSRTTTLNSELAYQDIYLQYEAPMPAIVEWIVGLGRQDDPEARHLNAVAHAIVTLSPRYSLTASFEHQHSRIFLTEQKYYSQRAVLSLARAPDLTMSIEGEHQRAVNQAGRKVSSLWYGAQLDWHLLERNDLSLFVGSRKSGKICSSGICVYKPEFRGVSLALTTLF
jgi:hypothetical protein